MPKRLHADLPLCRYCGGVPEYYRKRMRCSECHAKTLEASEERARELWLKVRYFVVP